MKKTVNESDFIEAFKSWESRKDSFTVPALKALFNYYEELEADSGVEMELDVVAIDCDWYEYDSFEEVQDNYSNIETIEELQDRTQIIELANGHILVMAF